MMHDGYQAIAREQHKPRLKQQRIPYDLLSKEKGLFALGVVDIVERPALAYSGVKLRTGA
jgi:hypothetical protein